MNKKASILVTLLAAAAVIVSIVACNKKAQQEQAVTDTTQIPVKLVSATVETISEPVFTSGFISSSTEARLSFKTGGLIQRIYVDEGQSVQKGQLLASLNLTEVNAMVEQAREAVEKAQRDYDRTKNLYKDTVASLEQFQNVATGLNVAKQQYEMVKFNQSYSEIRAANDGKIVRKMSNEGEMVAAGAPVFFMNATGANDWLVKAGIADKDWARLKLGNTATIKIDAYPDDNFTGAVSQLAQAPDPMSGLYQVEIKVKPSNKSLAAGFFCRAEIKPDNTAQFVSIPVDAVTEGNGQEAFVFTTINNKAHKQAVKTAFIRNGRVLLVSGLAPGAEIITDGSAYLTDGAEVKLVK